MTQQAELIHEPETGFVRLYLNKRTIAYLRDFPPTILQDKRTCAHLENIFEEVARHARNQLREELNKSMSFE